MNTSKNIIEKQKLIEYYSQFMTSERFAKIEQNSRERTQYATVILEDIQQPHNISAAIRSAECFGIQDIHVVEQHFKYILNPGITKGAGDWLDIYRYKGQENNTQMCFEQLKQQGYTIYAATPHTDDVNIDNLPLDSKVALTFGTEYMGLSEYALKNVDGFVKIPMYGFTESFNVSVSVAICLYDIIRRLHNSTYPWRLSQEEILDLQIKWLERSFA